ncbi:MAG: hypothetical protein ABW196_03000 [Solirubrobacterales bacterium]
MHKAAVVFVIGAVLCGLLAQGCGDSSEDRGTSVAAAEISEAEYVRQADAICAEHENKMGPETARLYREAARPDADIDTSEEGRVSAILVPSLESELDELEALGDPVGDRIPVEEILGEIQQVIDEADEDPEAFLEGFGPYEKAEKAAERYGITRCPVR